MSTPLRIRGNLEHDYADVLTPKARAALTTLAPFDTERKALMTVRMRRRAEHARNREQISFMDPGADHPADPDHRPGRPRRGICGRRHSIRSAAAVDSGDRSGGTTERAA